MSFNYYNRVVREDLRRMAKNQSFFEIFNNKTVLITGATGMLATYITYLLIYLRKECTVNVNLVLLCRTKFKADKLFMEFYDEPWFTLLLQDVCDPINYGEVVDYIFHLAGNASPYYIKNDPVGIVKSNLIGTFNVFEYAKGKHVKKVLFASTREVYGKNEEIDFLTEKDFGSIDPLESRSCYPESKRAAETICKSYFMQYGIPFNIVRIAHSYGPGMNLNNDGRIMADLISNVVNGEDIVLKSEGLAERSFCYITDAISAMFLVLIKGEVGKAYNIANETEPIIIKELANKLADMTGLKIVYKLAKHKSDVYCNYRRSGLDAAEIKALCWFPIVTLSQGLKYTIDSFSIK